MAWQAMAGQSAMNTISSIGATINAKRQSAAARAQALGEVDRLHREMEETRDQFRGARDDAARDADYQMGAMIAAMADNGGSGTLNASRLMGEVSFFKGLNIGRLNENRKSAINSLKTQQVAANQNALNVITGAWQGAMKSWMNTAKAAGNSYLNNKATVGSATRTQEIRPMTSSFERLNSRTFGANS